MWGNSILGAANPNQAEDPIVASPSVTTERYEKEHIVGSPQNEMVEDSSAVGSSQSKTVVSNPIIVVQPEFLHPTFESPIVQPNDYDPREVLPLHDGVSESPIEFDFNSNNRKINYGPSAFKTDPFFALLGEKPSKESNVGVTKSEVIPKSDTEKVCQQCDPTQFQNLLRQLDIGFQQYHQNVVNILNEYSANSNCANSGDSAISNIEYDTAICTDRNRVMSDPQLAAFCEKVYGDLTVEPSSGVIEIPGQKPQPARGYEGQFISFADFAKMLQNPNFNSNTLNIVGAENPNSDEQIVGIPSNNDANQSILKELKILANDPNVGNANDKDDHILEKPETIKVSKKFKEFIAKLKASGLMKKI